MSKSIKIFSFILIIVAILINFYSVYATDINMNLTSNEAVPNEVTAGDVNTVDLESSLTDNTVAPDLDASLTSQEETISASSVGTLSEQGLSLSNILSILLITVGVILILLAIAIIIRLK